jgi:hypothetical protein
VIGQYRRTLTATVSSAAIILAVGLVISSATAASASAQITPSDTARADTTNLLVVSDTTKEVKHVVKKGDTLWDLAQFYLKDPFRWPEIFRRNTDVVENPHWIYPGEIIRIWGHEVRTEAMARADSSGEVVSHVVTRPIPPPGVSTTGAGDRSDLTVFASPLSRAAATMASSDVIGRSRSGMPRRGEIEAAPYADRDGGPRAAGRLVSSVDRPGIKSTIVQSRYQLNDDLYVNLPRGQIARLGDLYMSYVLGPNLGDFGQVVIPTGILRIESVTSGQSAVARIIRQFGEIKLDQRVTQAPDVAVPTGTLSQVVGGLRGTVIYVPDEPVLPSIGHYILVSHNAKSGVHVGDEVTFIDNSIGGDQRDAAPPVIAGVGQVVRVTQYAATAIIVRQTQPTIRNGMPVRLTGKMP